MYRMEGRRVEQALQGAGGYQISGDVGRAYRHGSHAQIFFLRRGLLIYFPEIKEFKGQLLDFLNPFNGRAAPRSVIGIFISLGGWQALIQSKNVAKFRVGGVAMPAHHDG